MIILIPKTFGNSKRVQFPSISDSRLSRRFLKCFGHKERMYDGRLIKCIQREGRWMREEGRVDIIKAIAEQRREGKRGVMM